MAARSTSVQPTTTRGGRKLSDEAKQKLSTLNKERWAALPDAEKAARLARIGRAPRPPADPPPATGGSTNPLHDAPGARPVDRPAPQGPLTAPPRFVVPDLPPLELGADEPDLAPGEPASVTAIDSGFAVSDEDVGDLVALPFDLVALRRGEHWKLRAAERELLGRRLASKINEHAALARAIDLGGDYVAIAGSLSVILYTRVREDERRARAARDGSGEGGGAPPPAQRDRGDAVRRGPGPVQDLGSLNGASVPFGANDDAGPAAVDSEAPGRPLVQAL
jgi:hypothetical protein